VIAEPPKADIAISCLGMIPDGLVSIQNIPHEFD